MASLGFLTTALHIFFFNRGCQKIGFLLRPKWTWFIDFRLFISTSMVIRICCIDLRLSLSCEKWCSIFFPQRLRNCLWIFCRLIDSFTWDQNYRRICIATGISYEHFPSNRRTCHLFTYPRMCLSLISSSSLLSIVIETFLVISGCWKSTRLSMYF